MYPHPLFFHPNSVLDTSDSLIDNENLIKKVCLELLHHKKIIYVKTYIKMYQRNVFVD